MLLATLTNVCVCKFFFVHSSSKRSGKNSQKFFCCTIGPCTQALLSVAHAGLRSGWPESQSNLPRHTNTCKCFPRQMVCTHCMRCSFFRTIRRTTATTTTTITNRTPTPTKPPIRPAESEMENGTSDKKGRNKFRADRKAATSQSRRKILVKQPQSHVPPLNSSTSSRVKMSHCARLRRRRKFGVW